MSQIYGDVPQPTTHLVEMTMQEREVEMGGRFIDRRPTGMAWGECSCGVRVEGRGREPLPAVDVQARLYAHLKEVSCPLGMHGEPQDITALSDQKQRLLCPACGHIWDGEPLGGDLS